MSSAILATAPTVGRMPPIVASTPGRPRRAGPRRRADYGASASPAGGTRLAARSRRWTRRYAGQLRRPPGLRRRRSAGRVRTRPRRQWQNWLENLPRLAAGAAGGRARPARLRALVRPRSASRSPATGRASRPLRAARPRARSRVWATPMGGFVGAEMAIQFAPSGLRLVLVSAAGISAPGCTGPRLSARAGGRRLMPPTPRPATAGSGRRPVARHLALALVARHPRGIAADLAYEGSLKGAGKSGFDDALRPVSSTTSASGFPRSAARR